MFIIKLLRTKFTLNNTLRNTQKYSIAFNTRLYSGKRKTTLNTMINYVHQKKTQKF